MKTNDRCHFYSTMNRGVTGGKRGELSSRTPSGLRDPSWAFDPSAGLNYAKSNDCKYPGMVTFGHLYCATIASRSPVNPLGSP
jgi:hypothetical protein